LILSENSEIAIFDTHLLKIEMGIGFSF